MEAQILNLTESLFSAFDLKELRSNRRSLRGVQSAFDRSFGFDTVSERVFDRPGHDSEVRSSRHSDTNRARDSLLVISKHDCFLHSSGQSVLVHHRID